MIFIKHNAYLVKFIGMQSDENFFFSLEIINLYNYHQVTNS
jgi:hypothetical protein